MGKLLQRIERLMLSVNIRLRYYPSPNRCEYVNQTLDFIIFTFSTRQAGLFSTRRVLLYAINLNYTQVLHAKLSILFFFSSRPSRIPDCSAVAAFAWNYSNRSASTKTGQLGVTSLTLNFRLRVLQQTS